MSPCVLRAHVLLSLKNIALDARTSLCSHLPIKGREHVSCTDFIRFTPSIAPKYLTLGGSIVNSNFKSVSNFYCSCKKVKTHLNFVCLPCTLQPCDTHQVVPGSFFVLFLFSTWITVSVYKGNFVFFPYILYLFPCLITLGRTSG